MRLDTFLILVLIAVIVYVVIHHCKRVGIIIITSEKMDNTTIQPSPISTNTTDGKVTPSATSQLVSKPEVQDVKKKVENNISNIPVSFYKVCRS